MQVRQLKSDLLLLQDYSDCIGRKWYDAIGSECEELIALERQLVVLGTRPRLRVAIAGAFSSGKSAFVNYILKSRNVAVEGACPTTRSGTEYVYGDTTKYWIARGKVWREITALQYRKESCKENSCANFRVTVRSKLLRDFNLTVVDTPGFDGNKSDSDVAKKTIMGSDVIFWIINAASGELKKEECSYLYSVSNDGKIPVVLVITQIENTSPFNGSKLNGLEIVRKKILETANNKRQRLRISGEVIAMSSKPEGVKIPSIKPLVAHQDKNIEMAFEFCCERAIRVLEKKRKIIEDREGRIRSGLIKDLSAKAESLAECSSGTEASIMRRLRSIKRNFGHAVRSRMDMYFERLDLRRAIRVSVASDIGYWIYKPYRAVFDLEVTHFDSAAILEIVRGICGGKNAKKKDILAGLLRVKGYLDFNVRKSLVNDDWTHDADKKAREGMLKEVTDFCYTWSSELANEFFKGMSEHYEVDGDDECREWSRERCRINDAIAIIDKVRGGV